MFDKKKYTITFSSMMYESDSDEDRNTSSDITDSPDSINLDIINKLNIHDIDNPIEINDKSIIYEIIKYIKNLNKRSIVIIDGENLIGGPPSHRSSKVKRIFNKYNDINNIYILVVKKSGGVNRFKNYTGVDVPSNYIFISLHADNGTCPDDGFILELSNKLQNVIVVTDDEFLNRECFNYGDVINGTKLTSNICINGRYIPDIHSINDSLIKKRSITKKKYDIQC